MINSYDDLKAQRAQAHNDLQLAKSKLTADSRSWQEGAKPLRVVTTVAKNMFSNQLIGKGKKGLIGKGVQLGVNSVLAQTALKGLPLPIRFLLPQVVENVAINYTNTNGREWLIKGLRWIKKITEEKDPQPGVIKTEALVPMKDIHPVTDLTRVEVDPLLPNQ